MYTIKIASLKGYTMVYMYIDKLLPSYIIISLYYAQLYIFSYNEAFSGILLNLNGVFYLVKSYNILCKAASEQ